MMLPIQLVEKNDEQDSSQLNVNPFLDRCRGLYLKEKPNIKNRVEAFLQNSANLEEVSKNRIAKHLNISPRTLSRKLKQQETSYQDLLTEERKRRCCYFVVRQVTSGTELAKLLGYSEPAYFYQSFRKWTNLSFGEAKALLAQKSCNVGLIFYGDRSW